MWTSHALALAALVGMLAGWVAVQRAWRRVFPDAFEDPDVLAGRPSCGGCARTPCRDDCAPAKRCERREGGRPCPATEEDR